MTKPEWVTEQEQQRAGMMAAAAAATAGGRVAVGGWPCAGGGPARGRVPRARGGGVAPGAAGDPEGGGRGGFQSYADDTEASRSNVGRRVAGAAVGSSLLALGGNFLGVTSLVLERAVPESTVESLRLDVLYPVGGFKRCLVPGLFTFVYPEAWLADVTVARRRAERQEAARDGRRGPTLTLAGQVVDIAEPQAAFGPRGSTGETNVSVIAAPIQRGFDLADFGGPEDVARFLLGAVIAPEGSGREATLVAASQATHDAVDYYTVNYRVRGAAPPRGGGQPFDRRNVAVFAARGDILFTLNGQCPEVAADMSVGRALRKAADSFRLIS